MILESPSLSEPQGPSSPTRRRLLKRAALLAALGGLPTGFYAHEIEPRHLRLEQHTVPISGWPPAQAGLKIGQLSDLHCDSERAISIVGHAVQMLLAQQPDIVFLTGDYVSRGHSHWTEKATDILRPLSALTGRVYAILGNHDWDGTAELLTARMSDLGFHVLRNQAAPLAGIPNAWVVGLDDYYLGHEDLGQALHGVPANALKFLLVHEPDFADASPPGFALQCSGHSHGGQIRLPGLPPLYTPTYGQHYPEGLQHAPHHPVYTSRGIGMVGPHFRLCCPPEVTLLHLIPAP